MMDSQKLFLLLLGRLLKDGALNPTFIGEFACHAALPTRRRYPPLYAWVDSDGALHIDSNRAALARICVIESIRAESPVAFDDDAVTQAVAKFADMANKAFVATMGDLVGLLRARSQMSARQRSVERWAIGAR